MANQSSHRKSGAPPSHKLSQHELAGSGGSSHNRRGPLPPHRDPTHHRNKHTENPAPVDDVGAGGQRGGEEDEDEDETEEEDPPDGRPVRPSPSHDEIGDGITEICSVCPGRRCVCALREASSNGVRRSKDSGRGGYPARGRGSLPGPIRLRLSRSSVKTYGHGPNGTSTAAPKINGKNGKKPRILVRKDSTSSLSSLGSVDDEGDDRTTVPLEDGENSDADDVSSSLDYGTDSSSLGEPASEDEASDEEATQVARSTVNSAGEGGEARTDDEDELGDVFLEYTDFGADGRQGVVTLSDADDFLTSSDEDKAPDQEPHQGEFAELLLMDVDDTDFDLHDLDENSPFYLDKLDRIAASSESDDGDDESDDVRLLRFGSSDLEDENQSEMGYLILEEVGSSADEGPNRSDEDSLTASDDEGATTDSLDEDDHSGLVRYGIETADDAEPQEFWDLPEDSRLGEVLKGLEAQGSVEFFVMDPPNQRGRHQLPTTVPVTPMAPSNALSLPMFNAMSQLAPKLPVMGSFDTQTSVRLGSTASTADDSRSTPGSAGAPQRTRTILNDRPTSNGGLLAPSPFSGGKVVRYNRFRKLREKQMRKLLLNDNAPTAGESESATSVAGAQSSARPTPQVGGMLELPGTAEEEEADDDDVFDITAFIRGISSKEGSVSADESPAGEGGDRTDDPLAPLSRWSRVPMSAFRNRRTMAMASPGWGDARVQDGYFDGALRGHRRKAAAGAALASPGIARRKKSSGGSVQLARHKAKSSLDSPFSKVFSSPSAGRHSTAVGTGSAAQSRKARRALKKAQKVRASSAKPALLDVKNEVPSSLTSASVAEHHGLGGQPPSGFGTPFFASILGGAASDVPMLDLSAQQAGVVVPSTEEVPQQQQQQQQLL